MTLGEYIEQVLAEKRLSVPEVARRSDGEISANYIRKIIAGRVGNVSIPRLQGLAKGMGEDEDKVLGMAGVRFGRDDPWPADDLVRAVGKIISNEDFTAIVKELMKLDVGA